MRRPVLVNKCLLTASAVRARSQGWFSKGKTVQLQWQVGKNKKKVNVVCLVYCNVVFYFYGGLGGIHCCYIITTAKNRALFGFARIAHDLSVPTNGFLRLP